MNLDSGESKVGAWVLGITMTIVVLGGVAVMMKAPDVKVLAATFSAGRLLLLGGDRGSVECQGRRLNISWQDTARRILNVNCLADAVSPTTSPTSRPSVVPTQAVVASPTTVPSQPTQVPGGSAGADAALTFPVLDARLIGGWPVGHANANPSVVGCSAREHDRYKTVGPDGRMYRSWHPITVWMDDTRDTQYMNGASAQNYIVNPVRAGTSGSCSFGHDHGDPPLVIAKPSLSGVAYMPAFGYTNVVEGRARLEPHAGFKVFTHLAENQSGWRVHETQGGKNSFQPQPADWDMQVTFHQGAPSANSPCILAEIEGRTCDLTAEVAVGATRIYQQFHEYQWWGRSPQGQITDIKVAADTGAAVGKSVGDFAGAGKTIVDRQSPAYEIWNFDARVGTVWRSFVRSFVLGPLDFFDGTISAANGVTTVSSGGRFRSTQATFCGNRTVFEDPSTCSQYPYGSWRTPAYGFSGLMRGFDVTEWSWNNSNGSETYCTDARGNIQDMSLCDQNRTGFVVQRVARIGGLATPNTSGWSRNANSPDGWYSRMFPDDRMPVGTPLGN